MVALLNVVVLRKLEMEKQLLQSAEMKEKDVLKKLKCLVLEINMVLVMLKTVVD